MTKNDYLDTNGFKILKVPKYITNTISEGILKNLSNIFPGDNLGNFKKQVDFIVSLSEKKFKECFGKNAQRILDYKTNKIVNEWVKKKFTKDLKLLNISNYNKNHGLD